MKVVHVTYTYTPDPIGGTEVYVGNLIRTLRSAGVEGVVVAAGMVEARYEVDGIAVRRIPVSEALSLRDLYGEGDALAARVFVGILEEVVPDIVHFHAYTSGASQRMLREARAKNLPTVFTYHTPTVTCQRGDLLELGESVCDGLMETVRCTRCALHERGLPRIAAEGLARLPRFVRNQLTQQQLSGGAWTALRMRELVGLRQTTVRSFLEEFDRIVVPADWVRKLLIRNGVQREKLLFNRQGTTASKDSTRASLGGGHGPLKFIWLGRLDPTKGLDIIVEAFASLPNLDAELDAYGIREHGNDSSYAKSLASRIFHDPRIRLLAPVASHEVPKLLKEYCALLVPSNWLETGPLVILEAFAVGLPVIGSPYGGIAELLEDGKWGIQVESNTASAWAAALQRVADDRGILADLAARSPRPRLMDDVAVDMHSLYDALLAERCVA